MAEKTSNLNFKPYNKESEKWDELFDKWSTPQLEKAKNDLRKTIISINPNVDKNKLESFLKKNPFK